MPPAAGQGHAHPPPPGARARTHFRAKGTPFILADVGSHREAPAGPPALLTPSASPDPRLTAERHGAGARRVSSRAPEQLASDTSGRACWRLRTPTLLDWVLFRGIRWEPAAHYGNLNRRQGMTSVPPSPDTESGT